MVVGSTLLGAAIFVRLGDQHVLEDRRVTPTSVIPTSPGAGRPVPPSHWVQHSYNSHQCVLGTALPHISEFPHWFNPHGENRDYSYTQVSEGEAQRG